MVDDISEGSNGVWRQLEVRGSLLAGHVLVAESSGRLGSSTENWAFRMSGITSLLSSDEDVVLAGSTSGISIWLEVSRGVLDSEFLSALFLSPSLF